MHFDELGWGQMSNNKDNRNWKQYNEELVVRGMFYLDFEFVKSWDRELGEMNKGKRGGQYKYPISFMKWETVWKQWIDYRGLEGIARSLANLGLIPNYNDYTTAWHRIHGMIPEIRLPTEKELEAASDGSGLKTNNAGEYRVFKYGKETTKKKYLVVIITADIKNKKLLKVEAHVEGEGESEPKVAEKHLRELKKEGVNIKKFYGDGAFDTNQLFDCIDEIGIESAIKIRGNASTDHCRGSKRRRREIREYHKLGYEQWASEKQYGMRWVATEGIFSAVKRKFGENCVSKNSFSLIAEGTQRFWVYELLREYGKSGVMNFH